MERLVIYYQPASFACGRVHASPAVLLPLRPTNLNVVPFEPRRHRRGEQAPGAASGQRPEVVVLEHLRARFLESRLLGHPFKEPLRKVGEPTYAEEMDEREGRRRRHADILEDKK